MIVEVSLKLADEKQRLVSVREGSVTLVGLEIAVPLYSPDVLCATGMRTVSGVIVSVASVDIVS